MNFAQRNKNILDRIDRHVAHPSTAELRKAAVNCFTVAQKFSDHRDEMAREGFFTADGRRAKLAEALNRQVAREMRQARAPIDAAVKGVERLRGQIKPAQLDRTAVAEMRRAEIRTWMRGLSGPERMEILLNQREPNIIDSVLDAPAALSGVLDEHYAIAKATREEQLLGPQFREIEGLAAVVDEADVATTIACSDLANVAEMDRASFDKLVPARESLA
jgi:hypothetical protein